MRERFFYLVVVLIFLSCGEFFGQSTPVEKFFKIDNTYCYGKDTADFRQNNVKLADQQNKQHLHKLNFHSAFFSGTHLSSSLPLHPLPETAHLQSLSFFCRKEWQFEKATSIPLRVRLGSLEYTNYLEQKPNAARPK